MWTSKAGLPACTLTLVLASLTLTACRRDMQDQPKYKPFHESQFFADHRSERPRIEGTVARGHLHLDPARYTGKVNNEDVDYIPIPITRADVARGQERFNIYCSPCHSRIGDGMGLVVLRGFRQPPSYFSEKLINQPLGHYFDVMTNGFGSMPSYDGRVAPDDRWRIIAYIKALQLSMSGTIADVPPDQQTYLKEHPDKVVPQGPTNYPPANPAVMNGTVPDNQTASPPNSGPGATPVQISPGSPASGIAPPKAIAPPRGQQK
jgi:mono/diheme cytochrome c family protein